jgi:hypothetical protein
MATNPKPIRKAAKAAVVATKEEIKKPAVTGSGSPKQNKAGKLVAKTWTADKTNYIGRKVSQTAKNAGK